MNTLSSPLSRPVRACRLFSSAVEVSVRWSQVYWGRAVTLVWLSWPPPPLFSFPLGLPARREEPWALSQSMILPLIDCQQQESQSDECVCSLDVWTLRISGHSLVQHWHKLCVESLFSLSLPQCYRPDLRKTVWTSHNIPLCYLYNKTHQRIYSGKQLKSDFFIFYFCHSCL